MGTNFLFALHSMQFFGLLLGIAGCIGAAKEERFTWRCIKLMTASVAFGVAIRAFVVWGIWMSR